MQLFIPHNAYINPKVLTYPSGKEAIAFLNAHEVPLTFSKNVNINEESVSKNYSLAKKTIYLTVNGQKKLRSCRPSADYQFSLSSSCPGYCTYCYLQTTQGEKPFIKVYVNIEEILSVVSSHISKDKNMLTSFESGSITDPVATDHFTHGLAKCIKFFGQESNARLRVITKFAHIDSYLSLNHNGHTKFRFSLNSHSVIKKYEHGTSNLEERIHAARKIANAHYPIGFIIAPIIIYEGWEEEYESLFIKLSNSFSDYPGKVTFELIQHRFTQTAKDLILSRFPNTDLDMDEDKRQLKWGPYGKYKYVYPKESQIYIKDFMYSLIRRYFNHYEIEYFT